ncbi:hypothetical protein BG004_008054 [Podila humilis]|nr:hypothetical protein BG004_008054 [Podila humilis]
MSHNDDDDVEADDKDTGGEIKDGAIDRVEAPELELVSRNISDGSMDVWSIDGMALSALLKKLDISCVVVVKGTGVGLPERERPASC